MTVTVVTGLVGDEGVTYTNGDEWVAVTGEPGVELVDEEAADEAYTGTDDSDETYIGTDVAGVVLLTDTEWMLGVGNVDDAPFFGVTLPGVEGEEGPSVGVLLLLRGEAGGTNVVDWLVGGDVGG